MIPRLATDTIQRLAREFPVLAITGPRQSGKTTLVQALFNDRAYVSLENPDERAFAEEDPRSFLHKYRQGAVFDEAQRAPALFSYLQQMVDENPEMGRFILTGSQQFGLMSGITQTLAGRAALLHLLPFSIDELFPLAKDRAPAELDQLLFSGLYPPVHDRQLRPEIWYANYLETYVERDVRQLVNIRDLNTFRRFVKLCAGRVGQLVNLSSLAMDAGITHNTAKSWLSILEAGYIIFHLSPYYRSFNKRIIKTPKLYFYDTGLCARLLGIQNVDQISTHALRGALFESFVISELFKNRFNRGLLDEYFFWRDRSGNEVDILVERGDRVQPIEIKSGRTVNKDFFKGLHRWTALARDSVDAPLLVYGGDAFSTRAGVTVYPWFAFSTTLP